MFDDHGRAGAALPNNSAIEFLRVQLSSAMDGSIFVAVTATSVDEPEVECFELVDQELANNSVATIDDALALVSEHARRNFPSRQR